MGSTKIIDSVFRMVIVLLSIFVLEACSRNRMFVAPEQEFQDSRESDDIPVYLFGENVDFDYEVNSHVIVDLPLEFEDSPLSYTGKIPEEAKASLKNLAAGVDADAIIGLVNNSYYGWSIATYFASGIAVNKDRKMENRNDFITCLLPLANQNSSTEIKEFDLKIRVITRHVLTSKGYYVLTPPISSSIETGSLDKFAKNGPLKELCGMSPDILIGLYQEEEDGGSKILKADVYSVSRSQYLMGGSESNAPDLARPIIFGGLSGYISAKIGADESTVYKLFKPLPSIVKQVN